MNILFILVITAVVLLTFFMCLQESKRRKIHFITAIIICILTTPLLGYLIISSIGLRNPIGCKWCGNSKNESEYCGICHKNAQGEMMP